MAGRNVGELVAGLRDAMQRLEHGTEPHMRDAAKHMVDAAHSNGAERTEHLAAARVALDHVREALPLDYAVRTEAAHQAWTELKSAVQDMPPGAARDAAQALVDSASTAIDAHSTSDARAAGLAASPDVLDPDRVEGMEGYANRVAAGVEAVTVSEAGLSEAFAKAKLATSEQEPTPTDDKHAAGTEPGSDFRLPPTFPAAPEPADAGPGAEFRLPPSFPVTDEPAPGQGVAPSQRGDEFAAPSPAADVADDGTSVVPAAPAQAAAQEDDVLPAP
jgi:hypothetical protein